MKMCGRFKRNQTITKKNSNLKSNYNKNNSNVNLVHDPNHISSKKQKKEDKTRPLG